MSCGVPIRPAGMRATAPADAAWAVYFLAGGKPRQLVPTKVLKELAREAAGLPEWLFDESYEAVGDLVRRRVAMRTAADVAAARDQSVHGEGFAVDVPHPCPDRVQELERVLEKAERPGSP